jgi:ABC-type polysaccharide/polyol phosphate transport system ATPase subunit
MAARCAAIAEWAGLEDAINLPLRTYSSGMVARLAFSIATDTPSDLILIDEVLSVGDNDFQIKSRQRMNSLINSGAAVVLVSHDLESVRELATRVLWIEKGQAIKYGDPNQVVNAYLEA